MPISNSLWECTRQSRACLEGAAPQVLLGCKAQGSLQTPELAMSGREFIVAVVTRVTAHVHISEGDAHGNRFTQPLQPQSLFRKLGWGHILFWLFKDGVLLCAEVHVTVQYAISWVNRTESVTSSTIQCRSCASCRGIGPRCTLASRLRPPGASMSMVTAHAYTQTQIYGLMSNLHI